MLSVKEKQRVLQEEVLRLSAAFVEDVEKRVKQSDAQYITGLKKLFTLYMDTVKDTEPHISATPKLATLLHTYFTPSQSSSTQVAAGVRHMRVQPTAISRRRKGVSKGNKLSTSGRPFKHPLDHDTSVQTKRGRLDHVKRKQNLKLNEVQNQANHHKHGRGH